MMQELITAANTAGLFKNKVFGRRTPAEWTLQRLARSGRSRRRAMRRAGNAASQRGQSR